MLLFVLSTLAVFHFALPAGTGDDAAYGLLWIAIVFTALLGLARAWAPEREGGALDGLVLAPCDRSAIWLGKSLATLAFLAAAELVAMPAFALFFAPVDAVAIAGVVLASIGICAVGSLLAAMAAVSRGREVILPLLFLPLAIPLVVGGVGAGISPDGGDLPVVPRPLRPRVRDTCVGHLRICRHGITSRSSRSPPPACSALAVVLALLVAPEDAEPGHLAEDLLLPRPDRPHRLSRASGSAPGRRCGCSGSAASAATSRATPGSTRARSSAR